LPLWELKEKKGETREERADRVLRILQGMTKKMTLEEAREWFQRHKGAVTWEGLSSEPCQVCNKQGKTEAWVATTGETLHICLDCKWKAL